MINAAPQHSLALSQYHQIQKNVLTLLSRLPKRLYPRHTHLPQLQVQIKRQASQETLQLHLELLKLSCQIRQGYLGKHSGGLHCLSPHAHKFVATREKRLAAFLGEQAHPRSGSVLES